MKDQRKQIFNYKPVFFMIKTFQCYQILYHYSGFDKNAFTERLSFHFISFLEKLSKNLSSHSFIESEIKIWKERLSFDVHFFSTANIKPAIFPSFKTCKVRMMDYIWVTCLRQCPSKAGEIREKELL